MRGGKLVTANKSTVMAKPSLHSIVVEDGQGDGCLADPAGTNESDWSEVLSEIDYLLDQLVASKEGPRWQRRGFSRYPRFGCQIVGLSMV